MNREVYEYIQKFTNKAMLIVIFLLLLTHLPRSTILSLFYRSFYERDRLERFGVTERTRPLLLLLFKWKLLTKVNVRVNFLVDCVSSSQQSLRRNQQDKNGRRRNIWSSTGQPLGRQIELGLLMGSQEFSDDSYDRLFVSHDQSELVSCRWTRSLVGPRSGEETSIPTFCFAGLP